MNSTLLVEAPVVYSQPAKTTATDATQKKRLTWGLVILIALIGIAVRVVPSAAFSSLGFDESLYRSYLLMLDRQGISSYPDITEYFLTDQRKPESITKLPPTRFLYIFSGWVWKRAQFGDEGPANIREPGGLAKDPALRSLENVSCLFSVLLFLTAGVAAWRMFGQTVGIGTFALMACTPTQIHMGQHALIDGYFAFWATLCVWALYENLKAPNHAGWLTLYGAGLALMVMTKENSFFVYVALCGLIGINRWVKWGTVTPRLLLITFAGPLLGVAVLVTLAGGLPAFIETYRLLVSKAQNLTYAIKTGDGPWYRYLVDLMIVSPIVLCLALGFTFRVDADQRRNYLYLLSFVVITYLIMCNVRYAMNLRYSTIWDLPLRAFAFSQLVLLTNRFGNKQGIVLLVLTAGLCGYELRQYLIFFSDNPLYELVTEGLLRSVKILK
jgi:hypothetical protein